MANQPCLNQFMSLWINANDKDIKHDIEIRFQNNDIGITCQEKILRECRTEQLTMPFAKCPSRWH